MYVPTKQCRFNSVTCTGNLDAVYNRVRCYSSNRKRVCEILLVWTLFCYAAVVASEKVLNWIVKQTRSF